MRPAPNFASFNSPPILSGSTTSLYLGPTPPGGSTTFYSSQHPVQQMTHQFYVSAQHVYQPAQQVYPSGQLSGQQVLPGLPVSSGHETILPNAFNAMTIPDSVPVIMEYLVNISKRRAFWSLNEDILKITILTTNTLYPSRKIRRIRACTHQRPQRKLDQYAVSSEDQYAVLEIMDDPNSTIEEYKRLEEEKARKHEKVLNWKTAKYGRIWYDEDVHDLKSVENEFPAIAFNDSLKSGASVSVMPLSTYLNLGLGKLSHTKLTVELADKTMKYPKGIAKNVLVGIGKFVFPVDFIILDMPEDIKVPLILGRPFLSTPHAKIDVHKRKITLRVGEEMIIFTSVKPASSLIKRVYMLSLREEWNLIRS
ncbi:putative ribonuclease H-like domain-containing protein [Tanacetum coccineum]